MLTTLPRCLLVLGLALAFSLAASGSSEARRRKSKKAKVSDARRKPTKKAKRYSKRGKKAYVKERWDSAIAAFELAYKEDPLPRFLHNIGRCYEMKGDLVTSVEYLERYLAEEKHAGDREDGLETLAIVETKLLKTHRKVRVITRPETASIRLSLGETVLELESPFEVWLTHGRWQLRASAEGRETHEQELSLAKGDVLELVLTLEEPAPEPEPVAAAQAPSLWPAWLALGTGAALLAGGTAFGVLSGSAKDSRDGLQGSEPVRYGDVAQHQEDAESHALWANVLLAGGAAAALAGVLMLLLADDAPADAAAGPVRAPPLGAPAGAGWQIRW